MSTKFTDPKIIAIELGLDKGSEPVPKPKTDEELLDDLLVEIGSTVSKGGYANYYSDKRKALSARMAALRTAAAFPPAPIGEALAERICRALIVHAFENDADAEKLILSHKELIARMLKSYPVAVPEAEAVHQFRAARGSTEQGPWFDGVSDAPAEFFPARTLYAAPSGEAVAQAYRAGFKAGKVWAEPTPKVEP